ncbi:MAG: hypothetical protein IKH56_00390 [Oscillospiraceae bacterium]|nr:hypothetical protein [Oscillospiraceae bacterium]
MFGTNEKHQLIRIPFGRFGSALYLYEDFFTHRLRLSSRRSSTMCLRSDFLFYLNPRRNNADVPYTYTADEAVLRMDCGDGFVEIVLTDEEQMRLRGKNVDLEIETSPAVGDIGCGSFDGAFKRKDGSVEASFGRHGYLLFKPLTGTVDAETEWDSKNARFSKASFIIHGENDGFELAIHESKDEIALPDVYDPFEVLVKRSKASFRKFCRNYPETCPPEYAEMAHYAKWMIWSHRTKVVDNFVQPAIFMHYQWLIATFAWQQSYNAMAMEGDPKEAWKQICTTFNYQDRYGRLPAMVSHISKGPGLQPPFQGFAFTSLIRFCGEDFLTYDECMKMYPKFEKWLNFWLIRRNAGLGDDTIVACDPNETGWDDSSMFVDGFPVITPCLMSFLALYMEMMSVLAAKCGWPEKAADWKARSRKVIDNLIAWCWNGERFLPLHNGKQVETKSLPCYMPLMLGDRLPAHIIDKCVEKLTEEDQYLTPIGLASENVMTEYCSFAKATFVHGRVAAPQQMIICTGLYLAGRYEAAEFLARRYCDNINKVGLILDLAPYDYYPYSGKPADDVDNGPTAAGSWSWNTWSACNFLILVNRIIGQNPDACENQEK